MLKLRAEMMEGQGPEGWLPSDGAPVRERLCSMTFPAAGVKGVRNHT